MKKYIKGFTLIELLVVIAIIGILSSIILVSLNGARKKAKDVKVVSDVQEIRTALETGSTGSVYPDLFNSTASGSNLSGSLTTNGPDVTNITTLMADAVLQNGANTILFKVDTNSTAGSGTVGNVKAYAIYGLTSAGTYFCIDSTGQTNQAAISTSNSTCPAIGS